MCIARTPASITAVFTLSQRRQVNVCLVCFEHQVRTGEWRVGDLTPLDGEDDADDKAANSEPSGSELPAVSPFDPSLATALALSTRRPARR
jgi:hypothetical protein